MGGQMSGSGRFARHVTDRRTVVGALGGAALGTVGAIVLSGRGAPAEAQDDDSVSGRPAPAWYHWGYPLGRDVRNVIRLS
jgi:hypothetical protein